MTEINLKSTIVFQKNLQEFRDKKYRIVINEGGTGSSKTYSLAQLFAIILLEENNCQLTIARKTFPALRATAMKDFFSIVRDMGIYREDLHNKSEHIFRYKTNEVDFISIDEPMKVRSRRRNYLWMNEANEFNLEDYRQMSMRTDKQIFMDYNPSHQFHWIYDELQTKKNCTVIRSTYKDNPFLAEELVREIEGYQQMDKNYWRIYGLGLRGITENVIYTHWQYCDELPESYDRAIYGLDFGYNNPSALVRIVEKDKDCYWDEMLYQSHLTNQQLIGKLKDLKISESDRIVSDTDPSRIKEIQDAGFNIVPADKAVQAGIDYIKSHKLFITKRSVNILKEIKSYSWKDKQGKITSEDFKDEPVKVNDHAMDAGRYGEYSFLEEESPLLTIV